MTNIANFSWWVGRYIWRWIDFAEGSFFCKRLINTTSSAILWLTSEFINTNEFYGGGAGEISGNHLMDKKSVITWKTIIDKGG